ncbi:zinc finger protein ZFPM1 [Hylobates moloch]|uniref:zinc finger protein ZFPM1 n=1 Tax=Hylobates moloch TaxID=81572 RepID=UPI0013638F49|nr:zinc finger protein ZFPM1 [Hylobates moloch]
MEAGEEVPLVGVSHMEQKATAPEALSPPSADGNSPPPLPPPTSPGGPQELEEQEPEPRPTEEEPGSPWSGPDELEPVVQDGQRRIRARLSLATGLSWGPFHGSVQTRASSPGQAEPARPSGPRSPWPRHVCSSPWRQPLPGRAFQGSPSLLDTKACVVCLVCTSGATSDL